MGTNKQDLIQLWKKTKLYVADKLEGYVPKEQLLQEMDRHLADARFANPKALTFTGAVSANYDGSEALTVDIPGDYITPPDTATVGQVVQVEEIDENGKPTKWNVADIKPGVLELVNQIYLEEDVSNIEITTDMDGNPLNEKHIVVQFKVQSSTGSHQNNRVLYINNRWVSGQCMYFMNPAGYFEHYGAEVVGLIEPTKTTFNGERMSWVMNNSLLHMDNGAGRDFVSQINLYGDFLAGSYVTVFRVRNI